MTTLAATDVDDDEPDGAAGGNAVAPTADFEQARRSAGTEAAKVTVYLAVNEL